MRERLVRTAACLLALLAPTLGPAALNATAAKIARGPEAFRAAASAPRFSLILEHVRQSNAPELIGSRRWGALVAQHREAIESSTTHESFAAAVNRLIDDSGISHFHYYTDDQWEYWHLQSTFGQDADGNTLEHVGIIPQLIEGRWFVRGVLEGSVASGLDVRVGDELVSADGISYEPVAAFRGTAGVPVKLRLQRRPGLFVNVEVTPVSESLYRAMQRAVHESIATIAGDGFKFAYMHAWTLLGRGEEYDVLVQMQESVDGLLLDYRDGLGGNWVAAERFLLGEEDDQAGLSHPPRWTKPVVILTADGTRSAKEIVVHKVKRARRAPLVGEPTPGHVISVGGIQEIGDDGLLMLPGQRFSLEGKPTEPDYPVKREIRFSAGSDPQLGFAKTLLLRLVKEQSRLNAATATTPD